jgi:hypothetical protein
MPVVADLCGLTGLPTSPFGMRKWLVRQAIPVALEGKRFTIALSDLPAPERLAYVVRECARAGLPAGAYDDAAHARLMAATPGMRARAERRAALVRALAVAKAQGLSQGARFALVQKRFGRTARRGHRLSGSNGRLPGWTRSTGHRRCWRNPSRGGRRCPCRPRHGRCS